MQTDMIQPFQIIVILIFLLILIGALIFVRKYQGKLSRRLHRTSRIRRVEDIALAPHQRLHLLEVDNQTFLLHTTKGASASIQEISGSNTAQGPMTLTEVQTLTTQVKGQNFEKHKQQNDVKSNDSLSTPKPSDIDQIASAIASARRRNPDLGTKK